MRNSRREVGGDEVRCSWGGGVEIGVGYCWGVVAR
jgi:hypothetical protein